MCNCFRHSLETENKSNYSCLQGSEVKYLFIDVVEHTFSSRLNAAPLLLIYYTTTVKQKKNYPIASLKWWVGGGGIGMNTQILQMFPVLCGCRSPGSRRNPLRRSFIPELTRCKASEYPHDQSRPFVWTHWDRVIRNAYCATAIAY